MQLRHTILSAAAAMCLGACTVSSDTPAPGADTSAARGATALDFAYSIHTGIGDHTVGVKINHEEKPLRTELHNGDIVEIRPKSRELTPYVIARETAGDRPAPAWMEVISSQMRVLVHNLPARQVIDTPVQEQLIVELYSK